MRGIRRCSGLAVFFLAVLGVVACSKDNTTPTSPVPSCTYTVAAQGSTAFPDSGGTGSVTVTTNGGCTWTAASNSSFVAITAGASGSGNGTVQYSVSANSGAARSAVLTIGTTTVAVTQAGAPTAGATLSPPTASSPIGGAFITPGRPTLVVNNAAATGNVGTVTYRFEVSDQPSFPNDPARNFTIDGVPQGSGATTSWVVNHDLGPDVVWYWHARATNGTTTTDYSTTETFSTHSPCAYTLSATAAAAPVAGGSVTFTVTPTASTCAWTATSDTAFLTVSAGANQVGTGTVTVTIAANATTDARSGTITIAYSGGKQTFTISQPGNCAYTPSPASAVFTNAAFTGQTVVVMTSGASCSWSAASDSTWLTVTAGSTNTGQGTITYAVAANGTAAQRAGNIVITGANGATASFVVTQQP